MNNWIINDKLKEIYDSKRKANSRYSVRAFARHLNMSNSALSQIMSRKRLVGPALAKKLEQKLDIRFSVSPQKTKKTDIHFKELDIKNIKPNLPWYFITVLELLKIENFRLNEKDLARQFKAPVSEVKQLLKDLHDLGYIEPHKQGYRTLIHMALGNIKNPASMEKTKSYQKKYLSLASESVDISINKRVHNTLFFRFSDEQLPKIQECAQKFFRDIARLTVKNKENPNSVYCTQVSSFPIIHLKDLQK